MFLCFLKKICALETTINIPLKLNIQLEGFWNQNYLGNGHLNVLLKEMELSYCLISDSNTAVLLKTYQLPKDYPNNFAEVFEQLLEQDDILRNFQGPVSWISTDSYSSLVPNAFFEANELAVFYQKEHFTLKNEQLQAEYIPNIDHYNVFAIHRSIGNVVKSHFANAKFHCSSSLLLSNILSASLSNDANVLFCNVGKTMMEVVILKNKALSFNNTYHFSTPEDFLYYLTNITHQEGLNYASTQLILVGDVYESGGLYHLCKQYYPNITFGKRPNLHQSENLLSNHPHHLYYELFAV